MAASSSQRVPEKPTFDRTSRRLALWLALTSLATAVIARAETAVLDLETALALATAHEPLRAAADAGLALADSAVQHARTWPNPELRLTDERGRGAFEGVDESSVLLAQTWELSGARGLQRRAAELGLRTAEAENAAALAAWRLDVATRFHEAVAAESRVAAAQAHGAQLERLADIAARRAAAGDLAGFESDRVAQLARRAALGGEEHAAARDAARARLAAAVGPIARTARLVASEVAPVAAPADEASGPAPALVALQRRAEHAEAEQQAAARPRLPITVGIGRKRLETPGGHDDALLFEATLPLPLFDRNHAEARRARAEADLARSRLALAEQDLEARRIAARAAAERLAIVASHYRDDIVPTARRLSGVASRSFADGELDLVGVLETLEAEAEAIARSIDLNLRAQLARAELASLSEGASP